VELVAAGGVGHLEFGSLRVLRGLVHGVSLRGSVNGLARGDIYRAEDEEGSRSNVRRFFCELGLSGDEVFRCRQVHGSRVVVAEGCSGGQAEADGVCTRSRGLGLMLLGADCPLLVVYEPVAGVLGVAHAGWRGTVGGIAVSLVETMVSLGGRASRMWAGIGPGICGSCYEVGEEVATAAGDLFGAMGELLVRAGGGQERWYFDLAGANRRLLEEAGLRADRIELSGCCTYESGERFPSYRREGAGAGRWVLAAGMLGA